MYKAQLKSPRSRAINKQFTSVESVQSKINHNMYRGRYNERRIDKSIIAHTTGAPPPGRVRHSKKLTKISWGVGATVVGWASKAHT